MSCPSRCVKRPRTADNLPEHPATRKRLRHHSDGEASTGNQVNEVHQGLISVLDILILTGQLSQPALSHQSLSHMVSS